jgi:hypothetical protein
MSQPFLFFIVFFFLTTGSQSASAGLKVLEGEHTIVYDIVNTRGVAFIPEYSNESFEQKVVSLDAFSNRVIVTSKMAPMRTRVPFPVSQQRIPADVAQVSIARTGTSVSKPRHRAFGMEVTRGSR